MTELKKVLLAKISSMKYWDIVASEMTETINAENVVNAVCDTIADYLKGGEG